ncbi:MAG: hypothetical protein L3J59_08110 [Methylococcaceae bacterium]|nr:hypothetical protein [Methylococcaceae bacterium]
MLYSELIFVDSHDCMNAEARATYGAITEALKGCRAKENKNLQAEERNLIKLKLSSRKK